MTTLLLAEHDNIRHKDVTNKALTAATALGGEVHVLVMGSGCKAVAGAAAKLAGVADACRQLRRLRRAFHQLRQARDAARRGAARRHAGLRHRQGDRARHLRAADLCRQRHPDGEVE
jgi:electron transfer flavoprotein alpha subunit